MTGSGACSSFSVATTVFVSLAICAVISYGVFYYFKQRLSLIEHSQMEQARIMQAIISRGLAAQQSSHPSQPSGQKPLQKEITITQSSLIEVSSDDDDRESQESQESQESDSDSDTESDSDEESESQDSAKWSIGDEIHQPDGYHEEFTESFRKNILIDAICIDSSYVVDSITINNADEEQEPQQKKIISLNKGALNTHNDDADDADDADDDSSSSSSSSEDQDQDQEVQEHKDTQEFELKIGYKPSATTPSSLNKAMQLNYGNMSVPALRQLAKERGLGGEEGDLQKLKKKDLVHLLQ